METIGAFEAKIRLSELLERSAKGESFRITRHGRSVGRIVPPENSRDPREIAEAVRRLKSFRGTFKGMPRDEFLAMKGTGSDDALLPQVSGTPAVFRRRAGEQPALFDM